MEAQTYNFKTVTAGDTCNGIEVTATLTPDGGTAAPIDLTGVDIKLVAVDVHGTVVLNLAVGTGITLVNAAAGTFRVDPFIAPDHRKLNYNLEFKYPSDVVKTYLKGTITTFEDSAK